MRWSDSEPHLTLGVSCPPYLEITQLPPAAGRLGRGCLLLMEVGCLAEEWDSIVADVAAARARHPTAPLILRVPEITAEALRLAHRAARLGVRAIVGRDEPLATVLRPILTEPDDLPRDLLAYVEERGHPLSPQLSSLVCEIVEMAPRHARLGSLLEALGHSERTVRHRFQQGSAPGPRGWHRGARALHAALRLQADPLVRLVDLAVDVGYCDHSGLTRQLTRSFGVTPAGIRGTLGWEWLADRWLAREIRCGEDTSARSGKHLPALSLA